MRSGVDLRQTSILSGSVAASLLILTAGALIGGRRWRVRSAERRTRELDQKTAQLTREIDERAKEQDFSAAIRDLAARRDVSLDDVCRDCLVLLCEAWPARRAVCARIVLEGQEFRSTNYREVPWAHSAAIVMRGQPAGRVDVGYLDRARALYPVYLPPWRVEKDAQQLAEMVAWCVRNVAERLQSGQVLHALSQAVDESPNAVLISDIHGQIEYVNAGFSRVTGYSPQEVIGRNTNLLKSGQQSPEFYAELWQTISSGREWRGEFINRTRSGESYWELASISPVIDAHGAITHYVKVGENITDRKRVENALRLTQHFLRIANQHTDMDTLLQAFVTETAAMTGATAVGIRLLSRPGTPRAENYAGTSQAFRDPACVEALAANRCRWVQPTPAIVGEDPALICQGCNAYGYHLGAAIPILELDEVIGHIFVAHDAGARIGPETVGTLREAAVLLATAIGRVRVLERARDRELIVRTLLDAPHDLALLIEPDGTVLTFNAQVTRLVGEPSRDLVGLNALDFLPPDLANSFGSGLEKVLVSGRAESLGESQQGDKTFDLLIYPIVDGAGYVVRAALYGRDITERKRIEADLRRTRYELRSLLALSDELVATLELQPLLDLTLRKLASVVDFEYASIVTLDGDSLEVLATRGFDSATDFSGLRLSGDDLSAIRDMLRTKWPFYVADFRTGPDGRAMSTRTGLPAALIPTASRSWLAAPLLVRNQMIGLLCLGHHQPYHYSSQELQLVQAFANEAAIAIENARLYQQAQATASAQERATRLAHELHDSVTQTLFTANLIANALPDVVEHDPANAIARLGNLRQLIQGALAQMRVLLLEMRPAELAEQSLGALLGLLSQGVAGQIGIPVELCVDGDYVLPADPQIVLYRIAQEALNNVAKHADANCVGIELTSGPDGVRLHIHDDGRGFDPQAVTPGHLGTSIMQERAEHVGATLGIRSQPGQGTDITVTWTGSVKGAGDEE